MNYIIHNFELFLQFSKILLLKFPFLTRLLNFDILKDFNLTTRFILTSLDKRNWKMKLGPSVFLAASVQEFFLLIYRWVMEIESHKWVKSRNDSPLWTILGQSGWPMRIKIVDLNDWKWSVIFQSGRFAKKGGSGIIWLSSWWKPLFQSKDLPLSGRSFWTILIIYDSYMPHIIWVISMTNWQYENFKSHLMMTK